MRSIATLGAVAVLFFGIYYQILLKDVLIHGGYWRTSVDNVNNARCTTISEFEACEKMVQHRPSGLLYLACSTPASRKFWEPSTNRLNMSARSLQDYVATYDPVTGKITRLKLIGFPSLVPLALHGMDVVPTEADASELFVYLVNHRPPTDDPWKVGANSTIEVFKTRVNSPVLNYMKTIDDPTVIITPNDIIGDGHGAFYFTNDNRSKRGIRRTLDVLFRLPRASVGYCHKDHGCKIAVDGLKGANGIAQGPGGLYFVSNDGFGEISVLERQDDDTLVLTDIVSTDMPMDNISVDDDGAIYISAFVQGIKFIRKTFNDPTIPSASAVLRLSPNTGTGQFYGERFTVQKIFQDDGRLASGTTTAVWDGKRKTLYLSGINSLHLTICKIEKL